MSRKTLLRIGLLFFASLILSFSLQRVFQVSLTEIQEFVTAAGVWAPLVYCLILLLGLVVPFNPVSDSIVVSIAALVFPPFVAILMTFIAHSIGLTINYSLARTYGDDLLRKLLSKEEVGKIERLGPKISPFWIFGFRFLLPLNGLGFDIISYAAGIAHMDPKKFYLASIVPWTILSILFFTSSGFLRELNPVLIFLPLIILVIIPLVVLSIQKNQALRKSLQTFMKK